MANKDDFYDDVVADVFLEVGTRNLLKKSETLEKSLKERKITKAEFKGNMKKLLKPIEKEPIERLFFRIGVYEVYKSAPKNIFFCADYFEIGKKSFKKMEKKLYNVICKTGLYKKIKNGNTSEIITFLIGLISAYFTVPLMVQYFVVYIVIKIGLDKFCQK